MEHDFSKIIQELSSHETQLKVELDQLTSRTKILADRLAQIQCAKSSLGGPRQTTKQSKKQDKQNRKAPGPTAVEEIITKILREKNSVPVADLMQQVKSNLLANGQSRIGLKSLFTKALTSPKFKTDQSQNVTIA
jgi:Na+-translocating ferredoxin:NAD+ oxidoreductase RNF subunit RnfB